MQSIPFMSTCASYFLTSPKVVLLSVFFGALTDFSP